uniref:Peptidase M14 domain-containing protein n=1 Tax=Anopheles minimus TaxID=112268 RepID=A0A182W781_9DIPT
LRAQDVDDFNPLDFFLTFDETSKWLEALVAKYPEKCLIETMGKSYEGRNIITVTINPSQARKVILVANLRAREWAAMSSAIYIIHELVRNSNTYPQAANFRWIIVPIPNPDGYEYTTTKDRNWCKNRVPQSENDYGVDLNRNFGYKWEELIKLEDAYPWEESFRGTDPFSELESQVIGDMLRFHSDAYLYVDMQTFGQLILIPWSYTVEPAPNVNFLQSIGEVGASAIFSQTNQVFEVGASAELDQRVSGSSMDYCYSIGIKACVIMKLSSKSYYIPTENIIPHGKEALIGVIAMAEMAICVVTTSKMILYITSRSASTFMSVLGLLAVAICLPALEAKQAEIPIECLNETKTSKDYNVFDFILSYNETQEWLTALATEYPEKCQLQTLGQSTDGRDISAISIYYDKPKTIILLGNLKAREWVGMTSAIYIIHELIFNTVSYPNAQEFQWIIVPITNPDGYEYSREHERKWGKTRSVQQDGNIGVSMESNFDVQWQTGLSNSFLTPSGFLYRGPHPFSEPETRAIKELLESHTDAKLMVDMQAFGPNIYMPWSYTDEPIPDIDLVRAVANAGRTAMLEQSQQEFDVAIVSDYAPFDHGTCADYCYLIGIKVCIILRQQVATNDIRTDQIISLGQEAFAGIQAMAIESDWQQWTYHEIPDPTAAITYFMTYNETNDFMSTLAQMFPERVKVEQIGSTAEGRDINMVSVDYLLTKNITIVANLCAREWVAMTSVIYFILELVYWPQKHPDLTQFRWNIVPIGNPDGYEYTMNHERYWSKNRSPQPGGTFGVSLNANFGY